MHGIIRPMAPTPLHRPPRNPVAGLALFAASQVAVFAIWWFAGWKSGLPALLVTHLPVVWATLWPKSRLLSPVLTQLPTSAKVVWLTVDDGPGDDTPAMLDLLDAHGAKATFFVVGLRAAAHSTLICEIARRGHGLGNHSFRHPSAWFWALPPARMREEITRTQQLLADITGTRPRWFRAVVGMSNPFVAPVLKAHGLARVAWTTRGFDAVASDPAKVVARIQRGLKPGAIVLLHEGAGHGRSVEILAALLSRLDELGYRTVLPEDLESPATTPADAAA